MPFGPTSCGRVLRHDRGGDLEPGLDRERQQPSRVSLANSANARLTVSGTPAAVSMQETRRKVLGLGKSLCGRLVIRCVGCCLLSGWV